MELSPPLQEANGKLIHFYSLSETKLNLSSMVISVFFFIHFDTNSGYIHEKRDFSDLELNNNSCLKSSMSSGSW